MVSSHLVTRDTVCTAAGHCVACLEELIGKAVEQSKGERFNSSLDDAILQLALGIYPNGQYQQYDRTGQNFCIAKFCTEVFFLAEQHNEYLTLKSTRLMNMSTDSAFFS